MERRKTRDIESVSHNRVETLKKIKSMLGHTTPAYGRDDCILESDDDMKSGDAKDGSNVSFDRLRKRHFSKIESSIAPLQMIASVPSVEVTAGPSNKAINSMDALMVYEPKQFDENSSIKRSPKSPNRSSLKKIKQQMTQVEDMKPSKLANIGYNCPVDTYVTQMSQKRQKMQSQRQFRDRMQTQVRD